MRRAIFGGSFNPIHNGHVRLIHSAIQHLKIDEAIVIPLGNPPHKSKKELIEGFHRINMCNLAFMGYNNITVSSMEVDSCQQSYTVNTLHTLRSNYPEDELYLIVGADMFLSLPKWYHYEELLGMVKICVATREQEQEDEIFSFANLLKSRGVEVCVLNQEPMPLSSTEIRERLSKTCEDIPIPDKVREYILQNNLYGVLQKPTYDLEKLNALVKSMVKEERYIHCVAVSQEAIRLANRYGYDPHLAEVAGLIHDICKQIPAEEQLQWVMKSAIMWDTTTLNQKHLLHGMAAAEYIWNELGIYHIDILNAVRYHTTGRPNMTKLEKIIFVADLTSAERDYSDVTETRALADESLESAIAHIMKYIIPSLVKRGYPISHTTIDTYNYYATTFNIT